MKTTIRILTLLMTALMVCFAFAACGEQEEGSTIATSYHSGEEYSDVDFSKAEVEVKADTPKEMSKVMKDITAGKYDGKVVQMEGINTRYGDNAGILQKNEDGTFVGAMYYIIDGTFPLDYPDSDANIRLKGVVVVNESNGARHLEVPKDQLEIL